MSFKSGYHVTSRSGKKNTFDTKSFLFVMDPYCMYSFSNSDQSKHNKNVPTGCSEGQQIIVLPLRLDCFLWVPKLLSLGINMSKPLKVAFLSCGYRMCGEQAAR